MPRTPSTTNTRSRRRTPTTVVPTNPANRAVADAPPGPRTTFQKHHQPPEPGPPPPTPSHPTPPGAGSAGLGVSVLQRRSVRDAGDTRAPPGPEPRRRLRLAPPGVAPQCGTGAAGARRALAGGYLRDAAGAVQALQRRLPSIQSDSAAPQPARGAATIVGRPVARLRELVAETRRSVGSSRGGGLCAARERAGPLPLRPLLPAPLQAPVRPGWEPRGRRSLPLPSERLLPLAPGASEMPGGRNSNQEGKGGGAEEGTYPALSLWGGWEGITTRRGGRREERGLQGRSGESAGLGGAAGGTAGERSPRGRAAWLGGAPGRLAARAEGWGAESTQPRGRAGGRTHGLSAARRGAASPRRPSSSGGSSGRRRSWRRRRRQQRLHTPAAGEAGKPSLLARSSPHPGSSSSSSSSTSSSPYPSGCQNPPALPSLRLEAGARRQRPARVHRLGRGRSEGARASPRAGGGAEVGDLQGDLGALLQPRPPPTPLRETEPLRSDASSLPPLLPFRWRWYRLPEPRPPGSHNQASDEQVFRVVLTPRDRAQHPDWSSGHCRRR